MKKEKNSPEKKLNFFLMGSFYFKCNGVVVRISDHPDFGYPGQEADLGIFYSPSLDLGEGFVFYVRTRSIDGRVRKVRLEKPASLQSFFSLVNYLRYFAEKGRQSVVDNPHHIPDFSGNWDMVKRWAIRRLPKKSINIRREIYHSRQF